MAAFEHHNHHGHQHIPRGHFPNKLDEKLIRIIRENLVRIHLYLQHIVFYLGFVFMEEIKVF